MVPYFVDIYNLKGLQHSKKEGIMGKTTIKTAFIINIILTTVFSALWMKSMKTELHGSSFKGEH